MSEKVLIVDDSLTVRMDLAEAFEAAGFSPIPCATVAAARAELAKGTAKVAILDVVLPDGDGVELLTEIRKSGRKTIVLMLSSETEVKDRIRGLATGADEYVGKPYVTEYVVARTRELLGATSGTMKSQNVRLLVIDDSITFRQTLSDALQGAGYDVMLAGSGEEGLRTAAAQRPHGIVVDGVLPGMDGPTVIRRVRLDAALRGIPCVLLTGSEGEGAEMRAFDAGADAFVRKEEDLAVILARITAAVRTTSTSAGETASLQSPKKILVVDDSATYRNETADSFRAEGFDVALATSGEEAIELLAVQTVDCILMDLEMPGLGGEETCRRIKAAPVIRETPLIIVTSREDREAMMASLAAGADDYVSKAGDRQILRARVRAQLRRKQFEDESRRIRDEFARAEMVDQLEEKNRELEAFSAAVSHDLRAPLRTIDAFSASIEQEVGEQLSERARADLQRVRRAAKKMGNLIDDLLEFSRVTRAELKRSDVDISALAAEVLDDLVKSDPDREIELDIAPNLRGSADPRLLRVVLVNLLGNGWKFTKKAKHPRIELSAHRVDENLVYVVKDNGAGFDMKYAAKLFQPFQRLHGEVDFPGTGIGLATIRRVIERHGGRVWAEGAVNQGATFSFTLAT